MTKKNKDIRTINARFKVRDAENPNDKTISGYAVVFDQPSEDLGGFIEYVDPHAFDGVDMSNVILLFNHNFDNTLARVTANNLQITVDDNGLFFSATLPDTQLGNDTYTNILNGNYQGCSFGFTIASDEWAEGEDGTPIHTINQIDELYEISICPLPAYTETSVQIERSLEKLAKDKVDKKEDKHVEQRDEPTTSQAFKVGDSVIIGADHMPNMKGAHGIISGVSGTAYQVNYFPTDGSAEVLNHKWVTGDEISADTSAEKVTVQDGKDVMGSGAQDTNTDTDTNETEDSKEDKSMNMSGKEEARDDDEQPIEQDGLDKHKEGEKRHKMAKDITPKVENEKEKQVRGFIGFLKSKGQIRADVTTASDGNGAVIPTQILDVQKVPNDPANLAALVNRQAVTAPSGDLPILQKNNARMVSKEELAANPALAFQGFKQVSYKIETLAGVIPVSYEAISDMKAADIQGLISQGVSDSRSLTENDKIGAVLQKAKAVAATSADDLKDAFNKGLSYYSKTIIASESFYADVDKLKDANGRYLFQDSITAASGKQLFGAPVTIVPDKVLGTDGDAKAFFGDPKAFVLETYKDEVAVNWVDNDIFGTKLAAYLRADFNVADDAAGKFITFTPASTGTGK
ncbi:phage major capsid protein [Liquorilactobacillus hordei]|uniref:phage major capsid protein n=1 Tax=Liquorilactobacillus hordei TaxID=468911 RepID=UPI0039EC201E